MLFAIVFSAGLSPRWRGNREAHCFPPGMIGSIPAQAGEPRPPSGALGNAQVYPRAGGGTVGGKVPANTAWGLSPRRRGNRHRRDRAPSELGSIPAQAGEPRSEVTRRTIGEVYPRAGGGTADAVAGAWPDEGLSPRRRGNQVLIPREPEDPGSIPAQAGEPAARGRDIPDPRVYPRAGGGTIASRCPRQDTRGLSPRRRGNPGPRAVLRGLRGSIPAQAGEPDRRSRTYAVRRVYPRAGGGTPFCPRAPGRA